MKNKTTVSMLSIGILLVVLSGNEANAGPEPFIGEIVWGGWNFCPRGWAEANGQLLDISENQALFSLLGTNFGGDGRTNFGLPDLRGRVAIHEGQGPGLSDYRVGDDGGEEAITLTVSGMPAHSHDVISAADDTDDGAGERVDADRVQGEGQKNYSFTIAAATSYSADLSVSTTGGDEAHENRPPYLALTACIALTGIYPSRN